MAGKESAPDHGGQWVLLEALGYPERPMSILAVDGRPRAWTSPARVVGTPTVEVAAVLYRQIASGDTSALSITFDAGGAKKRKVTAILGPTNVPFGFHVWTGPAEVDPPEEMPATGGYVWDAERFGCTQTFECANMSGTTRENFQAFRPVSDFTRRALMFKDTDTVALAQFAMPPVPGDTFMTTLSVVHIQTGAVMPWIMALKAVSNTTANGLFYDQTILGITPELPSPEELGLLQMAEELDKYLALVNLVNTSAGPEMIMGTWITSPPAWLRYDETAVPGGGGESYIHPDDRASFTSTWAAEALSRAAMTPGMPVTRSPRYPVRFAGWEPGEWVLTSSAIRPYIRNESPIEGLFIIEVSRAPQG